MFMNLIFLPGLLRKVSEIAIGLLLVTAVSGCLPQDVPLTTAPSTKAEVIYEGFSGLESAKTVNGSRVTLKWTSSTDPRVVAYNVYDATLRFQPRLIRTVTAPAEEVTLSGLSSQSVYTFRVVAANADQVEDTNSKYLRAIPYAGLSSAEVVSSTGAKFVFADASNADEAFIFCKTASDTQEVQVASIRNTSVTEATVNDLTPGIEYTCRAAIELEGFVDNNSNSITFTPMGQADHLVFSNQPGNGNAGQVLTNQPVVKVFDANNNLVAGGPDSTALITLAIADNSPTPGSIKGTVTVQAVGGVASFAGLNIEEAGQKIMMASKQDTSASAFGTVAMSATSNPFLISAGAASPDNSTIAITPADSTIVANGTDSYQVTISLKDAFNNPLTGIRPTFSSNLTGDTLTQPSSNTNAAGVATGSISSTIADVAPNLRRISILSPSGLSGVSVAAPMKAGTPTKVAYTVQPSNSPAGLMGMAIFSVEIQDAQGNRVTTGDAASGEVTISIASNTNGAVLSGTLTKTLSAGVASFSDLGIDKTANGYRLIASSGSLSPAYSNTFNITAGVPKKIAITGPTSVTSGLCSSMITIQLQDLGGNPANAIASTPVAISGLGSGSFYSSSACTGSAISSVTFSAGTATRSNIYFKSNKAEHVDIVIGDSSHVMTSGTLSMNVNPGKIGLIAQAPSPAAAGTPLRVVAGRCSTEVIITPMGADGNAGPTFIPSSVSLVGIAASQAQVFSDSSCTQSLSAGNIVLPVNTGPAYSYKVYLKDDKAEDLSLTVADNSGLMTTVTSTQSVVVAPSTLSWTGPSSVVAGACSTAFSIKMKDVQGNNVVAPANRTLNINGIPGTSVGRFYTTAACSGSGARTELTFPEGSDTLQVYFKSVSSDLLSLTISDPAGEMTTSQTINLAVSPSALQVNVPSAASAATNVCAGPFTVKTLDSVGTVTNAVASIVANLTGKGSSADFYDDSDCTHSVTSLTFSAGQNSRTFYFKGYFPEASLTLTATDAAGVLASGSGIWAVTAAKGWLGTASTRFDGSSNELWFRAGAKPVAARNDGIYTARSVRFSPDHRYMYIADSDQQRVLKYDYVNHRYIGWIGRFQNVGGMVITGSNLATPSTPQCVNTSDGSAVPGWCVGGQSTYDDNAATGRLRDPFDLADDGTYLYVINYNGNSVSRFNSTTGAFDGYIGSIHSNTNMVPATDGPVTCATAAAGSTTPGWCKGGTSNSGYSSHPVTGDGRLRLPTAITYDSDYLYVLNTVSVNRYNKTTGAFAGWIGMVSGTPSNTDYNCNMAGAGSITPGWCLGGSAQEGSSALGAMNGTNAKELLIVGDELIVFHSNGQSMRFDRATGTKLGALAGMSTTWNGLRRAVTDGSRIYFVDLQRVVKTDLTGLIEGWIGKVANNLSMSGNTGCNSLAINEDTPGWCLGGTSRPGLDETSFREAVSLALDGSGKIIVGQANAGGTLRKFDVTTGVFEGTLTLESTSPQRWSADTLVATERHGFDDYSMYNPQAVAVSGDYLFLVEISSSRVKKINRKTGELLGWIGALTSRPTGGQSASCLTANPFAASPAWCLGGNFLPSSLFTNSSMINQTSNGIFQTPTGIAADSTYVYVSDRDLSRVSRFRIDDGSPQGWIGLIATSPTGGSVETCNGASVGTFTPGWCNGGKSQNGTGDGAMSYPAGLVVNAGVLYVVDAGNHRINSYNASTGAFNGWIGRLNSGSPSGCTTNNTGSYSVSTSGWCQGGTTAAANTNDPGGGFRFWGDYRAGITTDGSYLYVANFHNVRIDKYSFGGAFLGSTRAREDIYTGAWTTTTATIAAMGTNQCSYPTTIWTDGTNMYGTSYAPCSRASGSSGDFFGVWKMDLATGQMIGWQGGIDPVNLPNDGESGSNCAGATGSTPGWCRNGKQMMGLYMGQFSGGHGFLTGDDKFIYVSDETGNRVTRIPK